MIKAIQLQLAAPAYQMHGVISESDGTSYTLTSDYVAPDRYQITREGEVVKGIGGKKSETIAIGKDTWSKMDDQPWRKSPVNMSGMMNIQKSSLNELSNDKTADVKFIGTESLDGATMNVYQFSFDKKDEDTDGTIKSTGKYWIGTTDNLPRKFEGETQMIGKTETHTTKTSGTYDYNTGAKIEPPM
ncbi:MAG: hypothetical protein ACR2GD_05665 [Pyrinomonadaceae bacterium]